MNQVAVLANRLGDAIAGCYSAENYAVFFGEQALAEGWSLNDALATWYGLGHLCYLVALQDSGIPYEKGEPVSWNVTARIFECWKMREGPMLDRWNEFSTKKEDDALVAYYAAKNAEEYAQFFGLFASEILGANVSFKPATFLERILKGEQLILDPILRTALASTFVKLKNAMMQAIRSARL